MVKEITGDYKIQYPKDNGEGMQTVDFTPPFARIPMIKGLEEKLKIKYDNIVEPSFYLGASLSHTTNEEKKKC